MNNPITMLPAKARQVIYTVFGFYTIVVGAIQIAYLSIGDQPKWLTVLLAVTAFLGTSFSLTAATHTPASAPEGLVVPASDEKVITPVVEEPAGLPAPGDI